MRIKEVHVENFRCLKNVTLHCDSLTALVGANGSGKSSFLRALEIFFDPNAKYEVEDFYNRDTSQPIRIRVTFCDLGEAEREQFASYIDGETLTVEKELVWPISRGSQKYCGSALRCPDFQEVRNASRVVDKRSAYRELVESGNYQGLPQLLGNPSGEAIEQALSEWEKEHPDRCNRIRDDGQFFGFKEVGTARLERFAKFVYIPAVQDAADLTTESKGSPIKELTEAVVFRALKSTSEYQEIVANIQESSAKLKELANTDKLNELLQGMNKTFRKFAPNASMHLDWAIAEVSVALPKALLLLEEDEFRTSVERTGHGAQRALIMTLLHTLAKVQAQPTEDSASAFSEAKATSSVEALDSFVPTFIFAIEEPELYQHPSRQRHLARVLLELTQGNLENEAARFQVIYTTHSPLFVDLQRFDQVRRVYKTPDGNGTCRHTQVAQYSMEQATRRLEELDQSSKQKHITEGTRARLQTLMTPWTNEGFFAKAVVLVEGEEDRAALMGCACALEKDFEAEDIAVIPCNGKDKLHKAAIIFRGLGIPTYVIWDSDEGRNNPKTGENHRLLKLHDHSDEDYPEMVEKYFACFKTDLSSKLIEELGKQTWDELIDECKETFGYSEADHVKKTPLAMQYLMKKAYSRGNQSPTLEGIIHKIFDLLEGASHAKNTSSVQ